MPWNALNSGEMRVIRIQSTNLAKLLLVAFSRDASEAATSLNLFSGHSGLCCLVFITCRVVNAVQVMRRAQSESQVTHQHSDALLNDKIEKYKVFN